MFRSVASPSTQSEEIRKLMACFITSLAERRCFEEPSDFCATTAQCENVAPMIDCEPTHATICSGAGLSGLASGDVVGGVLSEVAAGGGHPPAGAWAPAGMANISASPQTPSSSHVQGIRPIATEAYSFLRDASCGHLLAHPPTANGPAICSPSVNANEDSRRRNLSLRPRRKRWPGRWRGRLGAVLVLASAALCGSVPVAAASSSDAQATHAYLIAQYRLVRALSHEAAAARGAESAAAAQIARECPGVVSGIPQPSPKLFLERTPRAKGE